MHWPTRPTQRTGLTFLKKHAFTRNLILGTHRPPRGKRSALAREANVMHWSDILKNMFSQRTPFQLCTRRPPHEATVMHWPRMQHKCKSPCVTQTSPLAGNKEPNSTTICARMRRAMAAACRYVWRSVRRLTLPQYAHACAEQRRLIRRPTRPTHVHIDTNGGPSGDELCHTFCMHTYAKQWRSVRRLTRPPHVHVRR